MTTLAGIDVHATVSGALKAAGFPPAVLRQGGKDWPGYGFGDGVTATFVPDDKNLRPQVGDKWVFNDQVWNVSGYSGSEDAWELDLSAEVPETVLNTAFDFALTGGTGGRFMVRANRTGEYRGRWRLNAGDWSAFAIHQSSFLRATAGGPGALEVDLWPLDAEGVAGRAVRKTEVLL